MNDPYVLHTIAHELAITDMFHNLNGSHDVIKDIAGIEASHREAYLNQQRSSFILPMLSATERELTFNLEATLHVLAKYWKDSHRRFTEGDDGIGMDGVRWSVIKTFYSETKKYIALIYYHYLLHPGDENIDLKALYPGIDTDEIKAEIVASGSLTNKRIENLEHGMRVKAGKELEPVKYSAIPTCGVEIVDMLPELFTDKSLVSVKVRTGYWRKFHKLCISQSTDKGTTQEEKEIWVRGVINCLDAINRIADAEDSYGIRNLSAEFIGILESTFMQSSNPICVKKIAREIGALYFFDQQVLVPGETEDDSTHMEFFSELELEQMMGSAKDFYEKKLCMNCEVTQCPYDIYWLMFNREGEDNEKYRSLTPEEIAAREKEDEKLTFPQLASPLDNAQSYFEALYPKYMDKELKWKKRSDGVTNYHAYWVAYILSKKFPNIAIQTVGDYLGINNLRNYSSQAKIRTGVRDSIVALFRSKHLDLPNLD